MQYKLLVASALAAGAFADSSSSSVNLVSVFSVLETAIPSSLLQEALTNSAAVSSEIASEFSAGSTPAWFTALPTDIQTFLNPVVTNSAVLSNITSVANATALTSMANATASSGSMTVANSSTISRASLTTSKKISSAAPLSSASAAASSAAAAASSSSSTGGASLPTAIVGAGLAGAVGLVGLLAL